LVFLPRASTSYGVWRKYNAPSDAADIVACTIWATGMRHTIQNTCWLFSNWSLHRPLLDLMRINELLSIVCLSQIRKSAWKAFSSNLAPSVFWSSASCQHLLRHAERVRCSVSDIIASHACHLFWFLSCVEIRWPWIRLPIMGAFYRHSSHLYVLQIPDQDPEHERNRCSTCTLKAWIAAAAGQNVQIRILKMSTANVASAHRKLNACAHYLPRFSDIRRSCFAIRYDFLWFVAVCNYCPVYICHSAIRSYFLWFKPKEVPMIGHLTCIAVRELIGPHVY